MYCKCLQSFSDFIMKCATFDEHSSSCVVYSRFSGTLFPVSMIDGELADQGIYLVCTGLCLYRFDDVNAIKYM